MVRLGVALGSVASSAFVAALLGLAASGCGGSHSSGSGAGTTSGSGSATSTGTAPVVTGTTSFVPNVAPGGGQTEQLRVSIRVVSQAGNAIPGALVSLEDMGSGQVTASRAADSSGVATFGQGLSNGCDLRGFQITTAAGSSNAVVSTSPRVSLDSCDGLTADESLHFRVVITIPYGNVVEDGTGSGFTVSESAPSLTLTFQIP